VSHYALEMEDCEELEIARKKFYIKNYYDNHEEIFIVFHM